MKRPATRKKVETTKAKTATSKKLAGVKKPAATKGGAATKKTAARGAPKKKAPAAKAAPKKPLMALTAANLAAYRSFAMKSEPFVYSFDQLLADGVTRWDGVRNYEARNVLRAMKKDDTVLFYHSNAGLSFVGIAKVSREAYQDPTTDDDWSAVDIEPVRRLETPVSLATMKAHPILSKMALVTRSRISVTPVSERELATVLALAGSTP